MRETHTETNKSNVECYADSNTLQMPVEKVLEKLGPVHALGRVSHPDEQVQFR